MTADDLFIAIQRLDEDGKSDENIYMVIVDEMRIGYFIKFVQPT